MRNDASHAYTFWFQCGWITRFLFLRERASEAERRRVDNQSRRAGRGSGGGGSLEDLVETVPEWLQRVRERHRERQPLRREPRRKAESSDGTKS